MIDWKDVTIQRERYKDFAREIENDKLVDLADEVSGYRPLASRVLAWFGVRLSAVGNFLQQRYGPTVETLAPAGIIQLGTDSMVGTGAVLTIPSVPGEEVDATDEDDLAA